MFAEFRRAAAIVVGLWLAGAGYASAETIRRPNWERLPSSETMEAHYPRRAIERNLEGRAVIDCGVDNSGLLQGCRVISEAPENEGFGTAALAAAWDFKMTPLTRDGVPLDSGTVRIPINFKLAGEPKAVSPTGEGPDGETWFRGWLSLMGALLAINILAVALLWVWPLTRIYKAAGIGRGYAWLLMVPFVNMVAFWIAAAQVRDERGP